MDADWPLWRGDFIEASWLQGNTGHVPFRQYLEAALDQAMYLRVRPRVREGQPVNVDIRIRSLRLGRDQNRMLFMMDAAKSLLIDGQATELVSPYRSGRQLRGSESPTTFEGSVERVTRSLDVPVGPHTVGIVATFLIVAKPGFVGGMGFPATMPSDWQFEITRQFESPVEVVAADSIGVRLVADENLSALMRRAVTPIFTLRPRPDGSQYLVVWVNFSDPPMGVAFDIFVRDVATGREQWFGTGWKVVGGDGLHSEAMIDVVDDTRWMLESKSLQIILRPNAALAEPTADLFEIWGKELIYPEVRIMGRPAAN